MVYFYDIDIHRTDDRCECAPLLLPSPPIAAPKPKASRNHRHASMLLRLRSGPGSPSSLLALLALALAELLAARASFQAAAPGRVPFAARPSKARGRRASSADDVDAAADVDYARARDARIRNGHDAAAGLYRRLLAQNPSDTSAATFVAASEGAVDALSRVGRLHKLHECQEGWEEDAEGLQDLLRRSRYRHASIREHTFGLPTGVDTDGCSQDDRSLRRFQNYYPMGPTYVRPLVSGQGFDPSKLIVENGAEATWLSSLRCLTALFILSSCVPRRIFVDSVVGGDDTFNLMLRLGVIFVYDANKEMAESSEGREEWVVPLIHLFPLDIPPLRYGGDCQSIVLMTDLHPNVLGMTSIQTSSRENNKSLDEEGAVMYIGPDSLALVQHLHAMLQCTFKEARLPHRILDICTGSGIQSLAALAMLESLNSTGPGSTDACFAVAIDINERALRFARLNACLNGFKGKMITIHANILSEEVYPKYSTRLGGGSLFEEIMTRLAQKDVQQSNTQFHMRTESKFDMILANPPFIPVPPMRSDQAASSIRDESGGGETIPVYGLFSSGGATGEDCLRAIVEMAPSLLRPERGLLAIVSEFMNPPSLQSLSREDASDRKNDLTSKIEEWWKSKSQENSSDAKGIIFTNQYALSYETYATRRAATNNQEDIDVWKDHLLQSEIHSISPGLLFVQTESNEQPKNRLRLEHAFVPKTDYGSIWTPQNIEAVEYTRNALLDLFQRP